MEGAAGLAHQQPHTEPMQRQAPQVPRQLGFASTPSQLGTRDPSTASRRSGEPPVALSGIHAHIGMPRDCRGFRPSRPASTANPVSWEWFRRLRHAGYIAVWQRVNRAHTAGRLPACGLDR